MIYLIFIFSFIRPPETTWRIDTPHRIPNGESKIEPTPSRIQIIFWYGIYALPGEKLKPDSKLMAVFNIMIIIEQGNKAQNYVSQNGIYVPEWEYVSIWDLMSQNGKACVHVAKNEVRMNLNKTCNSQIN